MGQTVIRGNLAKFSLQFLDNTGAVLSPAPPSANLYMVYNSLNIPKRVVIPLTTSDSGVTWGAQVETTPMDAGTWFWHARCNGSVPSAVEDEITIIANPANPPILGVIPPQPVS